MATPVVLVVPQLAIGGTEMQTLELARGLPRRGFEPTVLCLGEGGPVEDAMRAEGVRVARASGGRASAYRLLASLARRAPLVHSMTYGRQFMDAVAARAGGARFVSARRNLRHWPGGDRLGAGERLRNALTSVVVANSEAVRARALAVERLLPGKVVTVHNGVDAAGVARQAASAPRDEARRSLGADDADLLVVATGNLKPVKGHDVLLRAFASAAARAPAMRLAILGRGPEEAALRRLAADLGVADRVAVADPGLARLPCVAACDAFALASRSEGLSNALLEAMALARPCVATRVGGNAEAIVDGESGLLAPPDDERALADALLRVAGDAKGARRMGDAARRRVEELFSVDRMVDRHASLYADLLEGRR